MVLGAKLFYTLDDKHIIGGTTRCHICYGDSFY